MHPTHRIVGAALLAGLLLLAGCGQKGPLYLPDEQEPQARNDQEQDDQEDAD